MTSSDHAQGSKGVVAAALAAVVFGAGSIWLGTVGLSLTLNSSPISVDDSSAAAGSVQLEVPDQTRLITLMIGGDVMLDRQVRLLGEKNGYDSLFNRVAPLLKQADLAVVNLEGPITANQSKTLLSNGQTTKDLTFTFAPVTAEVLARAGVTHVSLANNHSHNFGVAGFEETKNRLNAAGIRWFGNPWNNPGTESTACSEDICLTFIGYHEFLPGYEKVLEEVRRHANSSDLVVVMPHWGDEYATVASPRLREKARELIAAGADMIVGAHPHVVMENETMEGVPVFYSIGNFLFDQYFSKETMTGALLEIEIVKDQNETKINRIIKHTVSNASKTGVDVTGQEIVYQRPN